MLGALPPRTASTAVDAPIMIHNARNSPGTINQPRKPTKEPPYQLDQACYKQPKPNLNGPAAQVGPGDTVVP